MDETKAIWRDAARVLRLPAAPPLLRALEPWPSYLAEAWRELRPNLLSRYLDAAAAGLRASVVFPQAAGPAVREAVPSYVRKDVDALLHAAHDAAPRVLVAAVALDEAASLRPVGRGGGSEGADELSPAPWEEQPPPAAPVDQASAALLARIATAHGRDAPAVYRAVAAVSPAALAALWTRVQPLWPSAITAAAARLAALARGVAALLPFEVSADPWTLAGPKDAPNVLAVLADQARRAAPLEAAGVAAALQVWHGAERAEPWPRAQHGEAPALGGGAWV